MQIQVGTVSWNHLGVCYEAMCCSSKLQTVIVLRKKLYFIVFVLQLYGMYHLVCEQVVHSFNIMYILV